MDPGRKARDDSVATQARSATHPGNDVMRIAALILVRVAWLVPTLAGLVAVVFLISRVIPSDPVALLAGETASRAQIELLRQKLGLDRPLPVQLVDYYRQLYQRRPRHQPVHDARPFGTTFRRGCRRPSSSTIAAMIVAVVLGIPLGVVAALYRNRAADHVLRIVTVAGLAVASFWLALMLQLYFSMELRWLPLQARITGFPPPPITGFYVVDALMEGNFKRARQRAGATSRSRPSRSPSRRWRRSCASPAPACSRRCSDRS